MMKKIFFCLVVAAVTISATAFTNKKSKSFISPFLVQMKTNEFTPITRVEPFSVNCEGPAILECYYERVPGKVLPNPANTVYYTPSEIIAYLIAGIIVEGTNSYPGLYVE